MIEFNIGKYAIRGRNPSQFLLPPKYYDLYIGDNKPTKVTPEQAEELEKRLEEVINEFVKSNIKIRK
jgi:hypothetical protein